MIKPIETTWRGYRFRSRTEARWAVLLTLGGIPFDYEPEGYPLPSGWYLPDFWLPDHKAWLEIKGQAATPAECTRCQELADLTRHDVLLGVGTPNDDDEIVLFMPGEREQRSVIWRHLFNTPDREVRAGEAYAAAKAERFDGKPGAPDKPAKLEKWWW